MFGRELTTAQEVEVTDVFRIVMKSQGRRLKERGRGTGCSIAQPEGRARVFSLHHLRALR